jgi:uncharacterized protein (DUF2235 family)
MKNIVICSDGTGNSSVKGRGTNVFKLFEAIDLNGHRTKPTLTPQVAFYDDGVGTENFKPLKVFAGATGYGLSRNVKQLYKELVRIYDPGDRIFLFGFSRGAFTTRTLAGLITTCGILDARKLTTAAKLEKMVRKAYKIYRRRYRTELAKLFLGEPDLANTKKFCSKHCLPGEVKIAFLGVWDTVDAVGLPFHISDFINLTIYRFKFPDRTLNPSVKRACHALSIDDQRHSFHPLLWRLEPGDQQRIEQVWFAGAHSNVGGGYPKQGMSLVALDWMMKKAAQESDGQPGLRFLTADYRLYSEHATVDDKLYDPRAGLGIFYRWKPRDITAMCRENNLQPAIHLSVLERIAHGTEDYAPGNLAGDAIVVTTPEEDHDQEVAALERAQEGEQVLRSAHGSRGSLLDRVKLATLAGRLSYYVYLACCTGVVLGAATLNGPEPVLRPLALLKNVGLFLENVATLQLGALYQSFKHLATSPRLMGLLVGGFLLSYILSRFADEVMSTVFSQFWHTEQPKLRQALKRAREQAAATQTLGKAAD